MMKLELATPLRPSDRPRPNSPEVDPVDPGPELPNEPDAPEAEPDPAGVDVPEVPNGPASDPEFDDLDIPVSPEIVPVPPSPELPAEM